MILIIRLIIFPVIASFRLLNSEIGNDQNNENYTFLKNEGVFSSP